MNQIHYLLIKYLPCCETNKSTERYLALAQFALLLSMSVCYITYIIELVLGLTFSIHEMSGDMMLKCFYHLIKPVSIKVFK